MINGEDDDSNGKSKTDCCNILNSFLPVSHSVFRHYVQKVKADSLLFYTFLLFLHNSGIRTADHDILQKGTL